MANPAGADDNYGFEQYHQQQPRSNFRGNIATIRFLSEGANTAIQQARRYNGRDHPQQQYYREVPPPQNVQTSSFIGLFPLLFNTVVWGFFALCMILISLGEFGLFYTLAMPRLHSKNTLHFDYTGTGVLSNHYLLRQQPVMIPQPNAEDAIQIKATAEANTDATPISNQTHDNKEEDEFCERETRNNTTQSSSSFFSPPFSSIHHHPLQNENFHNKEYQRLLQSAPVAVVDLFSNHDSWQHYHPDVVPQPKQEKRILTRGAPHYIDIVLDLPESKLNLENIGIFNVLVDLHSSSQLLASSVRTARIPHESFWISVVRKVVCIVPHVLGAIPESRRVIVPSYRSFVESKEFPLRYASVKLLVSTDKFQRGEVVEVSKGMLHIGEEMNGTQLVLKEWFFTCATIGTILLFMVQLVLVLMIRQFLNERRRQQEEQESKSILEDDVSEGLGLDGFTDIEEDDADGYAEQGEWEDLPQEQQTMEIDGIDDGAGSSASATSAGIDGSSSSRRRTPQNDGDHESRDTGTPAENPALNGTSPSTGGPEDADASRHVIPEN